ncbi:MAG TPA: FHA domain-containing protein, partial [Nannocystaceae bacterium]|nr:FHA domain-containing protein [Nannocystaceae bacterium]
MPGVVRAFEGLTPTVVVVGARLTIGRAADADVQLLDPHVSRRHARIERDESGAAVLVDLASTAGTHIGELRIDRHVLQHGDLIRIAGVTLRYEESPDPPRQQRAPVEKGMRSLRPTLRLGPTPAELAAAPARDPAPEVVIAPIEPIVSSPIVSSSIASSPIVTPPLVTPQLVVTPPAATTAPTSVASARVRSEARARTVRRWTPSGLDAEGLEQLASAPTAETVQYVPMFADEHSLTNAFAENAAVEHGEAATSMAGRELVRDIFDYRSLRMRAVRGEALPVDAVERLRELDERMHRHSATQRALDQLRRYHRFACDVPAWIGSVAGRSVSTLAIELKDVGAGGAQVTCAERRFQVGDPCWLVVDL